MAVVTLFAACSSGSSNNNALRSHTLNARAGALTPTIIAPGPTTPPE